MTDAPLGEIKTDTTSVTRMARYCHERLQSPSSYTLGVMLTKLSAERDALRQQVADLEMDREVACWLFGPERDDEDYTGDAAFSNALKSIMNDDRAELEAAQPEMVAEVVQNPPKYEDMFDGDAITISWPDRDGLIRIETTENYVGKCVSHVPAQSFSKLFTLTPKADAIREGMERAANALDPLVGMDVQERNAKDRGEAYDFAIWEARDAIRKAMEGV